MIRSLATAAFASLVAAACTISVDYSGTAYQCDPGDECPSGFECRSGTCVPEGTPFDDAGTVDGAPAVPDAGQPDAAAVAPMCGTTNRLVDDFDDGVTDPQWGSGFADTGTERVEQDGQLVIRVPAGAGDVWAGYYSRHAHDLTGSHARVRVDQVGPQYTVLEINAPGGIRSQVVESSSSGTLAAAVYGLPSGNGVRAEVSYDPVAHRWWQIREQSGVMFWEFSADGSAWETLHQEASPFPIEMIRVVLAAGGGVAEASEARMDELNPDGDPSEPWCPITDATDDFEDGEISLLWADSWDDTGCTLVESDGTAGIEFDGTADMWCGFETFPVFDACNGYASLEIPVPLDVADAEMWLDVYLPDGRLSMQLWEGMLRAVEREGGANTMSFSTTYEAAAHRWWRIRTDGSTTYWETSPNGADWTTQTTNPISLDCSRAYVGFGAGLWTSWTAGATQARFDNFNISF